ncbi:acyl-CoA dehydrogenase family protein [Abyssibius alkaniclasticus]|uniref:acyl-CoA dehydrogenase family protein n=1 Tax=Abyssibius alkaniclasticus TaxID=2881234 RepID=UPI003B6856AC
MNQMTQPDSPILANLSDQCRAALAWADIALAAQRQKLAAQIVVAGRIDKHALDTHQHDAHSLAWLATYVETLHQAHAWAVGLAEAGRFGPLEQLILQIGFGEYLAQIRGGIPMAQGEFARFELGAPNEAAQALIQNGNTAAARARLLELVIGAEGASTYGATGLDDEIEMIRDQFRRFADEQVRPFAHGWHLNDTLIPLALIADMGALGVFGLTVPEEFGGAGLGKTAMCVVSEELSRGYIGVGSLGTRAEIASELILGSGTDAQKAEFLPRIASGELLPTAVFTEPNTGSDLGALRCRAVPEGDVYKVTGNKTWITHAARADLMTMLVRTDPDTDDHSELSMLLAPKPRGTAESDFPAEGMSGGEIPVIGYRGMKEYELGFDGFEVPAENLLGGVAGQGFRQLMRTFESARIQTAARAIGVAQNALDLGLGYAQSRQQFGVPLANFQRISGKLAMMVVEIMLTRQLTYHAARIKDEAARCDLEAGMAKLLGARVAWAAADNALQIHGGNGFAAEYEISRVLCDARILNIFEGAAEIQAQVIARRLVETTL